MGIQQSGRRLYSQFTTAPPGAPKLPITYRKSEQVGQVNSENSTQATERFDSYLDLSNNNINLPIATLVENGELTLNGFNHVDIRYMKVEEMDTTGTQSHPNQPNHPGSTSIFYGHHIQKNKQQSRDKVAH